MKKTLVVLTVMVIALVSYFYFFGNPENKAAETAQKNFQASCDTVADALNLFKLGEIEKELPYKIIAEMQEIKKESLKLVKEARKIGPTNEGYNKLDKAMSGAESLTAVKAMLAAAMINGLTEELREIEKLLQQKNNELEI